MLYNTAWNNYNNLVICKDILSLVKEDKNKALEFIHKNFKEYNDMLEESEDTGEIMKFDVVIGNPPYNNDMYIPFVEMGYQLATECSVFITPAKWQAKGGQKNEAFRQNIVPYMSKIVYYPDCSDIFDINEYSGITYYIIDRCIHHEKIILNRSNKNERLNSDVVRSNISPLNNIGNNIVQRLNTHTHIFNIDEHKKYAVVGVNRFAAERGSKGTYQAYGTISYTTKNSAVIREARIIDTKDKDTELSTADIIVFTSDIKDECESFISLTKTKFFRFMLFININGSSPVYSEETWRFVPDPGAFDHIFTDGELYKKYNLTEEEIGIIESVIKERK